MSSSNHQQKITKYSTSVLTFFLLLGVTFNFLPQPVFDQSGQVSYENALQNVYAGTESIEIATSTQIWTVPVGVTEITVKTWGAGGGGAGGGTVGVGGAGGAGGYMEATIAVTPGEDLTVRVGGGGGGGDFSSGGAGALSGDGGGGGGYTALLRGTDVLVVAAGGGGGGGGDNSAATAGGAGGAGGNIAIAGGSSGSAGGGGGATVSSGGSGGTGGNVAGSNGFTLSGGSGADGNDNSVGPTVGAADNGGLNGGAPAGNGDELNNGFAAGGGGGGGYFGGGGGSNSLSGNAGGGGGGGGSSFATSTALATSTEAGSGAAAPNTADEDYDGLAGAGGTGGATSGSGTAGTDGLLVIQIDGLEITGTVYENDRFSSAGSGIPVKVAVGSSSPALYTGITDASGMFVIGGIASTTISSTTPITVFVDADDVNDSRLGTTFTSAVDMTTATQTISGIDIYTGAVHFIESHNDQSIDLADSAALVYDNADDSDILFDVTTSTTTVTGGLVVASTTELIANSNLVVTGDFVQQGTYTNDGARLELAGVSSTSLSKGIYVDSLDVSAQESSPYSIAFNSDGTKFYVSGNIGLSSVDEWALSVPFDLSTGVYTDTLSLEGTVSVPLGISFNSDGSKLYVLNNINNRVTEWALSIPFDVSTGTYTDFLFVGPEESFPLDITFNDTGSKLYVIGATGDAVDEWALSVPFDISTGVYTDTLDVSSQETFPTDIEFNSDGTKLYVVGSVKDAVDEWSLSVPYDVSTGVFVSSLAINEQNAVPYSIAFNADDTRLYVMGNGVADEWIIGSAVHSGNLAGASALGDVVVSDFIQIFADSASTTDLQIQASSSVVAPPGTLSIDGDFNNLGIFQENNGVLSLSGTGVIDGNMTGRSTLGDTVVAGSYTANDTASTSDLTIVSGGSFTTPTGELTIDGLFIQNGSYTARGTTTFTGLRNAFDVSEATNFDIKNVQSRESSASTVIFNNDGTKMYVAGNFNDAVDEWNLLIPYDVSTGVYVDTLPVGGEENALWSIAFNDDGTKLYVLGTADDAVDEWALSVPYDVSTGIYTDTLIIGGQETEGYGMTFNNDGTKLYIVGWGNDAVDEWALSPAYDVSTGVYTDTLIVSSEENQPSDVAFNADGTKLYVIGFQDDAVDEWTLSVPYDVSTGLYTDTLVVSGVNANPNGIAFSDDGLRMFLTNGNNADIDVWHMFAEVTGDITASNSLGNVEINGSILLTDTASTSNLTIQPAGLLFAPTTTLSVSGDYANSGTFQARNGEVVLSGVGSVDGDQTGINAFSSLTVAGSYTALATTTVNGAYTVTGSFDRGVTQLEISNALNQFEQGENFSVSVESPGLTGMTFNNDGTKMYTVEDSISHEINEWSLSTPFDVSTRSFTDALDISAQDTGPDGVAFNNDGTKMYVVGGAISSEVYEWALSVPFDVSTGVYTDSININVQSFGARGIAFNNDGSKMFIVDSEDKITEWALPTPYDVSTAVYTDSLTVSAQEGNLSGLDFSADGYKLYVTGYNTNSVYEWTLSTPFDVSTGTYTDYLDVVDIGNFISVEDIVFTEDYTKLYVVTSVDGIFEWESEAPSMSGNLIGTSALGDLQVDTLAQTTIFDTASTSDLVISVGAVLVAPTTTLSISGDYTNSGIFTATTSEVIFNGSTQQTATGTLSGTSALNDLTITNTSQNGTTSQSVVFGNDVETTGTMTMVASTSAAFTAGATSTFQNVDWQGSGGSPVWLRSTVPGNEWLLDISGSQLTVKFVDVQDSNASSTISGVVAGGSTDTGNNTNWTFGALLTISGTLYESDGTTVITTGATIKLAIGTTTPITDITTADGSGVFSFASLLGDIATNTPIIAFVDADGTTRGAVLTKASSSVDNITGLDIYQDTVIVKQEAGAASTTNADFATYDNLDDADLQYSTIGGPYDISTAAFDDTVLDFSVQGVNPTAMLFNEDGTILYVLDYDDRDINAYPLPTPYDIASYTSGTSIALSVAGEELNPTAMIFNNDGTILYVMGISGDDINAYPLDTAYDIGSYTSGTSVVLSVAAQETVPTALLFNGDGTILYVVGNSSDNINAYPLNTAYDIGSGTSSPSTVVLDVSGQEPSTESMQFNNDGTILYVTGSTGDDINAYPLDTAYDIGSYTSGTSVVLSVGWFPQNLMFNSDGSVLYVLDSGKDVIDAYAINPTLTINSGQELHVWTEDTFTPEGAVVVNGNAGTGSDGSLFIDENATLTTTINPVSLAGNLTVGTSSTYTNLSDAGTIFTATTTGKTIGGDLDTLGNLTFNGSGGAWTFDDAATTSDITITAGTVTAPDSTLSIDGDFTQNGTFTNNGGTVRTVDSAYDIGVATFDSIALDVGVQVSVPQDMLFNDDGTTLYVLGSTGDDINAYPLNTAYDISSYTSGTSVVLSVAGQETSPQSMLFNQSGTILYVMGDSGDDINAYPLNTAYDIGSGTSSPSTVVLDVSGEETSTQDMLFNNDGTILYVLGLSGDDINAYPLNTAYDISSYTSGTSIVLSVAVQETSPTTMLFNQSGTILFVAGDSGDDINAYPLPTPYDISSYTSGTSVVLSVAGQEVNPQDMIFNNDGTVLYVTGFAGDDINAYNLAHTYTGTMTGTSALAGFDIASDGHAVFANNASTTNLTVAGRLTAPSALTISNDLIKTTNGTTNFSTNQTNLYLTGSDNTVTGDFSGGDSDFYTLTITGSTTLASAASTTDVTVTGGASLTLGDSFSIADDFANNGTFMASAQTAYSTKAGGISVSADFEGVALSVSGQELVPQDMLFNDDGTTLYVLGSTGDDINAYPLNTAYDISSYTSGTSVVLSVAGQETSPQSMLFNQSGTILYVMGTTGDDINAYPLNTAYDIGSGTSSPSTVVLDVSGQEDAPTAMLFNDDGTILYVMGSNGDDINAYPLDTAYDISSYTSGTSVVLSVAGQETSPQYMLFNQSGTILYVMGTTGDDINAYPLPVPYDISSYVSGTNIVLSVKAQDTSPQAMLFNQSGTTLYVLGSIDDDIYTYSLTADWSGAMTGGSAFADLSFINDGILNLESPASTTGTFTASSTGSITFNAGSTYTFENVDWQGSGATSELILRSSASGTPWQLDVPGTQFNVEYVNVQDSDASSYTEMIALNSTDGGNNTNWSFTVLSGDEWNDTDWTLYDTITIRHENIDEPLGDFPVYVDLSDLSPQFWSTILDGGGDIRITTDAGTPVELAREVVSASTTLETGELHFKAPYLSEVIDTSFRIYYNGVDAEYTTDATYGAEGVWSNRYVFVSHDGGETDSTLYDNDGTAFGDVTANNTSGQLGLASDFDGAGDWFGVGDDDSLDIAGDISVGLWFTTNNTASNQQILSKYSAPTDRGWLVSPRAGDTIRFEGRTGINSFQTTPGTTPVTSNQWTHFVGTRSGSLWESYTNSIGSGAFTNNDGSFANTVPLYIARNGEDGFENEFDGTIDEVRIASTSRSAAWIFAEYTNQSTSTDFYTLTDVVNTTSSSTISNHDAGQVSNAFNFQNKTNEPLYAFKVTPESGDVGVTRTEIRITGWNQQQLDSADFTNIRLYRDLDNDAAYDVTDTLLSNTGTISFLNQNTQIGTLVFTEDFEVIAAENFLVVADWNAPNRGSQMNLQLMPGGLDMLDTDGPVTVSGSVDRIQHGRNNRGGGGGSSSRIGTAAPVGDGVVTGGDSSGGAGGGAVDTNTGGGLIGNDANFNNPTAGSGAWNNIANAYDQTDGTYATTSATSDADFTNYSYNVPDSNAINGIEVKLEVSGTTAAGNIAVSLSWDGGTSWTATKNTATLDTTDTILSVGGAADLWGRTWTAAELSNANFAVRLTGAPSANEIRVDAIQVRVYNQATGGGGGGGGRI